VTFPLKFLLELLD